MCKQIPVFCSNGDTDIENRLMDMRAGKESVGCMERKKVKKKKDTCILSSPSFQSDMPGNVHTVS